MRTLILGLLVLAGCGGSDPGLVGAWEYLSADGAMGEALHFDADGAYRADILTFTSASSANDERQSGRWEATGSSVTLTPGSATCAGLAAATLGWKRTGDQLVLSVPQGEVIYRPLPTASGGFTGTLSLGCYVNGAWVPAQ